MREAKQCLIIDDDQDDQEIFLMCLNTVSKHIDCKTADNGVEAIKMLNADSNYTPAYIFVDVNMPKMNGIECLKVLKDMVRLQHTKIFMYSTTLESTALAESKTLGADDFIVKPSSSAKLQETLSGIFNLT